MVWISYCLQWGHDVLCSCFLIQYAPFTVLRSSACCRNVPSRMEGDPRARIAPWGSSEDRAAYSEDLHSSASPEAQQQAQDAQPSSRGAPAHEEGMQAPGWGDVGNFSMGTLDAPSIAADDQNGKAEQQHHHSHRSAMTPQFPCKGEACRPTVARTGSTWLWLQALKDLGGNFAFLTWWSLLDALA